MIFRAVVFVLAVLCSFFYFPEASAGRLPSSSGEAGRAVVNVEKTAKRVRLKLITDGVERRITAPGNITVEACLKREGIDPAKYHVSVPLTDLIKKGMTITLKSKTPAELADIKKEQTEGTVVKYPPITGRYHAGSGAQLVTKEKEKYVRDEAGKLHRIVGYHRMEATAYLPSDGNGEGLTATGIPAAYGVAAVDPDVIPLGTRIFVPGYGIALAADTGGVIIGNIVDLCYEDYDEAIEFGRREVDVYLLEAQMSTERKI